MKYRVVSLNSGNTCEKSMGVSFRCRNSKYQTIKTTIADRMATTRFPQASVRLYRAEYNHNIIEMNGKIRPKLNVFKW